MTTNHLREILHEFRATTNKSFGITVDQAVSQVLSWHKERISEEKIAEIIHKTNKAWGHSTMDGGEVKIIAKAICESIRKGE